MSSATLTASPWFLTPMRQLSAHWLGAPVAAQALSEPPVLTAFEEAEQLRAMALGLMHEAPACAADLFAADRHEFGALA